MPVECHDLDCLAALVLPRPNYIGIPEESDGEAARGNFPRIILSRMRQGQAGRRPAPVVGADGVSQPPASPFRRYRERYERNSPERIRGQEEVEIVKKKSYTGTFARDLKSP